MYASMTFRQFRRRFRTEGDCLRYLIKRKWPDAHGHVALRKVPSVTSGHAQEFITHRVKDDTIMFSDGFSSYHFVSNDLTLGSGQRAVEIFPDVHRVIARLKTWIRGTHSHVSKKHLNRYLAEFSYRFNRRFKQRRIAIFDRLVTACCAS